VCVCVCVCVCIACKRRRVTLIHSLRRWKDTHRAAQVVQQRKRFVLEHAELSYHIISYRTGLNPVACENAEVEKMPAAVASISYAMFRPVDAP
jgi:hypothetical protein